MDISSIVKALRNFGSGKSLEERAATAKAASEEVSKNVPPRLMPRKGIEQKRAQFAALDEQTKDE